MRSALSEQAKWLRGPLRVEWTLMELCLADLEAGIGNLGPSSGVNGEHDDDFDALVSDRKDEDDVVQSCIRDDFTRLPAGVHAVGSRRDAAANARKALAVKRANKQRSSLENKFDSLAEAWDRMHGLRSGEKIDRVQRLDGDHTNQWTTSGMLRLGHQGIGKAAAFRGGVGEGQRILDALLSTTLLTYDAQGHAFAALIADVLRHAAPGIVIHRYHDAAPANLHLVDWSSSSTIKQCT